jgi:hypothetical protein
VTDWPTTRHAPATQQAVDSMLSYSHHAAK